MAGFTKIVPEIIQSSIWNESSDVRIVWIAMLATKDQNGYVRGDARTISRMANVPLESAEEALRKFQEPDPNSHTPTDEGRRIEKADGGFIVINHHLYREMGMSEENRQYWREKQRIHREKKANVNDKSKTSPRLVADSSVSVSVSDSVLDKGVQGEKVELPFSSEAFKQAWQDFIDHRKAKKAKMTQKAIKLIFKDLPKVESEAIASIEQSIKHGWTGVFPVKTENGHSATKKPLHQQTATFHSTGDDYLKSRGLI